MASQTQTPFAPRTGEANKRRKRQADTDTNSINDTKRKFNAEEVRERKKKNQNGGTRRVTQSL
jgi:hypothetical protein